MKTCICFFGGLIHGAPGSRPRNSMTPRDRLYKQPLMSAPPLAIFREQEPLGLGKLFLHASHPLVIFASASFDQVSQACGARGRTLAQRPREASRATKRLPSVTTRASEWPGSAAANLAKCPAERHHG